MKFLLPIFLFLTSGSAAAQATLTAQWQTLLQTGRRVSSTPVQEEEKNPAATFFQTTKKAYWVSPVLMQRDAFQGHVTYVEYDTNSSPRIAKKDLKTFALEFIAQNEIDFAMSTQDLRENNPFLTDLDDKLLSLHFKRYWQGIEVRDAYVSLMFTKQGEQFALRSVTNHSFGNLVIENPSSVNESSFDYWNTQLGLVDAKWIAQRLVVFTKLAANGKPSWTLATEFVFTTPDDQYTLTVENGASMDTILEAYQRKVYAPNIQGNIYRGSYLDGNFQPTPLAYATLRINNQPSIIDADGYFSAELPVTAMLQLTGSRANVVARGSNSAFAISVDLDEPTTLVEQSGDGLRALNSFVAIQRINRFVRRYLAAQESSLLGRNIRININVQGNCNAFYDGNISLFSEGGGCANMALVNDVIFHEWGHGLDDSIGRNPGISDGAFSEGIGDILAAYYVNTANMGAGFFLGSTQGIRTLDNTKSFPADVVNEVHADGLIIGGAFWDLREALVARHGAIKGAYWADHLFVRHLLTTDSYRDSYNTVLSLDDEDGNPATPSANRCLINKAFADHGLATALNCQDTEADRDVVLDEEIYLSVDKENDDGSVLLVASAGEGESMKLCEGSPEDCLAGTKTPSLEFAKEGGKDGRTLFLAKTSYTLKEQMLVTLIAYDGNARAIGSRTLKIVTK